MIRSTRLSRSVLWALFVVLGFLLGTAAQLAAAEPARPLAERIQSGPVKVIVMLRADAGGIAAAQERLAARLRDRGHTPSGWHAFSSLPAVAMEADAGLYAILATDPDVEGDTTALYTANLLKPLGVKVTRLAHGVSVGTAIEYADRVSLARALEGRREL